MNCFCVCFFNNRRDSYHYLSNKLHTQANIYSELPKPIILIPLTNTRFYRTTRSYHASNYDELNFIKGDILEVEESSSSTMCRAKHMNNAVIRLVSKEMLETESIYELNKWFFKSVNRFEAEHLLLNPGNIKGSFLVREAYNGQNPFVLSVRCEDHNFKSIVKHYRIHRGKLGYYITNRLSFDSLETLIEAYRRDIYGIMGLYQCLKVPCLKGTIMESSF